MERWGFFLRNAENLSTEMARELLPEPEFQEALGILEMIQRTPEERIRYQARLKFQCDEAARLYYARQEGLEQGRQEGIIEGKQEGLAEGESKGILLGQIQTLEQVLGLPQTSAEELKKLEIDRLEAILRDLQSRFQAGKD